MQSESSRSRSYTQTNGNASYANQYAYSQTGVQQPPPPPNERMSSGSVPVHAVDNKMTNIQEIVTNGNINTASKVDHSPTQSRSDSVFSRKRSYEQRVESSSDDDDDSPRRQEEDVTPKHKKRQPKVAAAYR